MSGRGVAWRRERRGEGRAAERGGARRARSLSQRSAARRRPFPRLFSLSLHPPRPAGDSPLSQPALDGATVIVCGGEVRWKEREKETDQWPPPLPTRSPFFHSRLSLVFSFPTAAPLGGGVLSLSLSLSLFLSSLSTEAAAPTASLKSPPRNTKQRAHGCPLPLLSTLHALYLSLSLSLCPYTLPRPARAPWHTLRALLTPPPPHSHSRPPPRPGTAPRKCPQRRPSPRAARARLSSLYTAARRPRPRGASPAG